MFVKFESLKFRNILSYGNDTTEVDFQTGMTLISAKSGSGKSTIIDALSFCLYGKPYRKIKINELINRRNKKKLFTECSFLIGEDRYKIIRTLLPNTIEIYKNDVSSEKLSSKKLNQEEINKIIGIDHNLFRQIIALSINYNKGFLALEAADKRDIIESIFNIKVFAEMLKKLKNNNVNLKIQSQLNLSQISILESTLKTLKTQIENVERTRLTFDSDKENNLKMLNEEFSVKEIEYNKKIEENKEYRTKLQELTETLSNIDFQSEVSELTSFIKFSEKKLTENEQTLEIIDGNVKCPVCNSQLTEEHKQYEKARLENESVRLKTEIKIAKEKRIALSNLYTQEETTKREITKLETLISNNRLKISYIKEDVTRIVSEIEKETNKVFNFDDTSLVADYELKKETHAQIFSDYSKIQEDIKYNEFAANILSEQGIKSFFFKKLIPILNAKINHYLDIFELPVSINFNEVMDEMITNVGGKENISYMAFSEGEKKRIDIAIILSFIDTTKTISNWNCNLLMFDEILDTSVDSEGLDKIMGSIKQMTIDDTRLCSYIISHRDTDHENYNRKMLVKKVGGFSTIR